MPESKGGTTSGGPADRIVAARGARLVEQAIEAEAAEIIWQYQELKDERGRQRVVCNGDLPERAVQTGIGEVAVRAPRCGVGELKFSFEYSAALVAPEATFGGTAAVAILKDTRDTVCFRPVLEQCQLSLASPVPKPVY